MAIEGTGTQIPGSETQIPGTGTQIPGTGTQIPGTGTQVPGTGTAIPGSGSQAKRPGTTSQIPVLEEYIIKGVRYVVDTEASIGTLANKSGEARIFVVTNGGRRFVLKLYIPNHGPEHTVLDKLQQAKGGFLVNLYDHGKWTHDASGITFDYEVMEYMSNGSLAQIILRNDEKRFETIAMRMAFAIRQCHELGIIHRDIKPENFMFTGPEKTDFVLIDFGIARHTQGKAQVKVDAAKSSYFVSPDAAVSSTDRTAYVGAATDYYSMGMTLLALLYGEENFYRMYPANDLGRLDMQKRRNTVVAEARRNGLRITDRQAELLEALLQFSDSERAGFKEVERWFKGEKISAEKEIHRNVSSFRVVFNESKNLVAHSPAELAKFMLDDPEFAKKFLYRGLAKNVLQSQLPSLALEIDDLTQTVYPGAEEQDAGLFATALLLDPSVKFRGVKGNEMSTLQEIAADLLEHHDIYAIRLAKKTDRLWIYLNARGDSKVKSLMAEYQPKIRKSANNGVHGLALALDPKPLFIDFKTGERFISRKKVAQHIWENNSRFVNELKDVNHAFYNWIRQVGFDDDDIKNIHGDIMQSNEHGLYAACVVLDYDFPFFSHEGKPLTTIEEVTAEIFEYWLAHSDDLLDEIHPLWVWLTLRSDELQKLVAETHSKLSKGNSHPLWELYYKIGSGRKPFSIQCNDDKKWYYVYSLNELFKLIGQYGVTSKTIGHLSEEMFALWLSVNESESDHNLAGVWRDMMKEKRFGPDTVMEYIYRLRPDISMNFLTDKDNPYFVGTAEQIGESLNREIDPGIKKTDFFHWEGGTLFEQLQSIEHFRKSLMRQYMIARNMESFIPVIEKTLDVDANIKAHPSAPYNVEIAWWKIMWILGAKPHYTFKGYGEKQDGVAYNSNDVALRSGDALKPKYPHVLYSFLTLSFHENIYEKFSFRWLKWYFEYLCERFPWSDFAKRGKIAEKEVNDAVSKRDKAWKKLKFMRTAGLWVCLPLMVAVIAWISVVIGVDGYHTVTQAIQSADSAITGILVIIGGLVGATSGIVGIVAGCVIGYLVGVLIVWALGAIAPVLIIGIIVFAAFWGGKQLYSVTNDTFIPNKKVYDDLKKQTEIYIVTKGLDTFHRVNKGTAVVTDIFDHSAQLATKYIVKARKTLIVMILTTIASIGLGTLVDSRSENIKPDQGGMYYSDEEDEFYEEPYGDFCP